MNVELSGTSLILDSLGRADCCIGSHFRPGAVRYDEHVASGFKLVPYSSEVGPPPATSWPCSRAKLDRVQGGTTRKLSCSLLSKLTHNQSNRMNQLSDNVLNLSTPGAPLRQERSNHHPTNTRRQTICTIIQTVCVCIPSQECAS